MTLISTVPSQNEWVSLEIKSLTAIITNVKKFCYNEPCTSCKFHFSSPKSSQNFIVFSWCNKSGNPVLHQINYLECPWLVGCGSLIYFWVLLIGCGSLKIVLLFEADGFKWILFWFYASGWSWNDSCYFKDILSGGKGQVSNFQRLNCDSELVKITKQNKTKKTHAKSWHFSRSNSLTCDHYGRTCHCNYLKLIEIWSFHKCI